MDQGGDGKGGEGGRYGSQFFITLADCRRELDGKCTMFGRVEGDGIYNVVRIGEGELAEGTERPVYPERILRTEVIEVPGGEAWRAMRKRERVAVRGDQDEQRPKKMAKREKKKGGKALLSFAGDEEDGEAVVIKPKKAKFNTALIDAEDELPEQVNGTTKKGPKSNDRTQKHDNHQKAPPPPRQTHHSPSSSISRSPEATHHRTPSFHESTTQLPLRDPEIPSRSRSSSTSPPRTHTSRLPQQPSVSSLNAEIAALKASMRGGPDTNAPARSTKLSALEQMIPSTSTRGRKRPRPGESNAKEDAKTLKMLAAFQARLDGAASNVPDPDDMVSTSSKPQSKLKMNGDGNDKEDKAMANGTEEAKLCDLHFIADCQSCSKWDDHNDDNPESNNAATRDDEGEDGEYRWMSHTLSFAKDKLGKDLNWKKKGEEELVVIDPREKERDIRGKEKEKEKAHRKEKRKA